MDTKSLRKYVLLTAGVLHALLFAGCICRINLAVIGNLLKTDEAGNPIGPSNDVSEKEHATNARSAIVMEPLNSAGIPGSATL